jgi:citrate synthase
MPAPGRDRRIRVSARRRVRAGLDGVVAGVSAIAFIDGARGRLFYRGYDVADLAEYATFEEVAHLLWHGDLPAHPALDLLRVDLDRASALPPPVLGIMQRLPPETPPITAMRTVISALGHFDPDRDDGTAAMATRKAVRLTAQVRTAAAAWHHVRAGRVPIAPRAGLSYAGTYLYLLDGADPDPEIARALEVALILLADHEFNASTFAARVTAATLADLHAAVTSAAATLAGPLHGGASAEVMALLERIGSVNRVDAVIAQMLDAGTKIPGFGHRVYRTEDPRAAILRRWSERVARRTGQTRWYDLARRVEDVTMARRAIPPNVDLYAAVLYAATGIPASLFAVTFAVGRVAGWTAHVVEQRANNRLIRPLADYRGPAPRAFIPLAERGS